MRPAPVLHTMYPDTLCPPQLLTVTGRVTRKRTGNFFVSLMSLAVASILATTTVGSSLKASPTFS